MDDGDRAFKVFAAVMVVFVFFIFAFIVYFKTVEQPRRCQRAVLRGEVVRLDWSGGWKHGVLIEFDTGSRIVRGRGHLPAVGDRAYVCQNNHAHKGDPHPR